MTLNDIISQFFWLSFRPLDVLLHICHHVIFVIYVVPDPTHIKEILGLYRVVKRKSHLQVIDIYPFGMLMKLKQKVTLTFSSVRN